MASRKYPHCPKCGEENEIRSSGKRYAVYPSGCLVLLSLPFAAIHQGSSPVDYHCEACDHQFGVRSIWAKICLGIIWLLILSLVVGVLFVVNGLW